nr:sigma-70 family RNA polymerase sigma factor [uncultured Oscillibacter sp.]
MESVKDWVDTLYLQYSSKMAAAAMRAGFSIEEAEDLTQEAFLLFLIKAPMIRAEQRSPGGYLFITLRNLIGDALRQRRRRKTLPYGEVPDPGKSDAYFTSLKDALPPELEEKDREILIAYYEDEIGYEELSRRLGIPVERCRVRVFRAKNRCRRLLEAQKNSPAEETKAPSETTRETGGDPDASR